MKVFQRFDRHADLMDRMAETIGIDLAEMMVRGRMSPSSYREAVFRCTGCAQSGACEEWLSAHSNGSRSTPGYCRNANYFDKLADR